MPKLKESEDVKKDKQIQNFIVSQMFQRSMNKTELALKLHMSEQTLRKKIKNPTNFSLGELRALANILRIPKSEIGQSI